MYPVHDCLILKTELKTTSLKYHSLSMYIKKPSYQQQGIRVLSAKSTRKTLKENKQLKINLTICCKTSSITVFLKKCSHLFQKNDLPQNCTIFPHYQTSNRIFSSLSRIIAAKRPMVVMDSLHIWLGLACGSKLLFQATFTKLIYMYCRWVKTALNTTY